MAKVSKRAWTTGNGEKKTAWIVAYKDSKGARRFKQFARRRDADAWLTKTAYDVSQGVHTPDSASVTVRAAAKLWIENGEKKALESSTLRSYQTTVDEHINPLIGDDKLSRLTMPSIEAFKDRLLESRSKATAGRAVRFLSMILTEAQRRGLIAQNVAKGVKVVRPSRDATEIVIPTQKELKAILKHAGDDLRPFVMTAILTGLRASELRGLKWEDIDLKAGLLKVQRRADEKNKLGPPKSKAGRRTIPLPPKLIAELRSWKLRCKPSLLELVFPSPEGNIWSYHNLMNRAFWPLLIKAEVADYKPSAEDGMPIWDDEGNCVMQARYSLHALRHAAASLWIRQGVDLKRLKTWMGHSSVQITIDTYGHLIKDEVGDAAIVANAERALLG